MANQENSVKENVPGKFFVDDQCVGCDMCRSLAPDFFEMNDNGNSYIKQQPMSPEAIDLVTEAMEACPVQAIGKNEE